MTDLAINPNQVVTDLTQPATYEQGTAGEAITAGGAVYLDSATQHYLSTDANDTDATLADARGIALNSAAANQPLRIQRTGRLTLGVAAAPVAGQLYVVSAASGKMAPASDVATGWHTTLVCYGLAGNQVQLAMLTTGQLVP